MNPVFILKLQEPMKVSGNSPAKQIQRKPAELMYCQMTFYYFISILILHELSQLHLLILLI